MNYGPQIKFLKCPRCEDFTYEKLKTHDYCLSCNYSTELDLSPRPDNVPQWALDSMKSAWVNYNTGELKDRESHEEEKSEVAA